MSTSGDGATAMPDPAPHELARPSLVAWQAELDASVGFRAITLMSYVRRIGYLFQANVAQYKALVNKMQEPASAHIFSMTNPGAHDELLSEAERLLHNVLTALSTRIDQQRCYIGRHFAADSKLARDYKAKIAAEFADAPDKFLKRLRNHITHHLLPVAQSRQSISLTSLSITFVLPVRPLLEWEWSRDVRVWIEAQEDGIEIVEIVDRYARKAGSFDTWLHDRVGLELATEIRDYECAAEEFNQAYDATF